MHRWLTIASPEKKNGYTMEGHDEVGRSSKDIDQQGRHLMHLNLTQHPRLTNIRHMDENVSSRMPVQSRPQPLLVKMVSDEPNTPAEHEQTVEGTDPDVLISLLGCEGARVTQEVDEAGSDATVNVQDKLERSRVSEEDKEKEG
jgi:hypothetical protein